MERRLDSHFKTCSTPSSPPKDSPYTYGRPMRTAYPVNTKDIRTTYLCAECEGLCNVRSGADSRIKDCGLERSHAWTYGYRSCPLLPRLSREGHQAMRRNRRLVCHRLILSTILSTIGDRVRLTVRHDDTTHSPSNCFLRILYRLDTLKNDWSIPVLLQKLKVVPGLRFACLSILEKAIHKPGKMVLVHSWAAVPRSSSTSTPWSFLNRSRKTGSDRPIATPIVSGSKKGLNATSSSSGRQPRRKVSRVTTKA